MKPARLQTIAETAVIAALLLASDPAAAQARQDVFQLGRWSGSVQGDFDLESDHSRSDANQSTDYSLHQTRETVMIRNSGWSVVDPTIMSGSLSLTLGRYQEHERENSMYSSSQGSLEGYGFDASLLGATPYAVSLYANRARTFLNQTFGRTDVTFSDEGAIFRFGETSFLRRHGIPYFSSTLRVEREHVEQNTINALGQGFLLDEIRKRLAYDGHNGFETSDLDWNYSIDDVEDPSRTANNSRTQSVALNYSRDFGADLNRRWDSRISHYHRSALTDYDSSLVSERLHIDHRSDLSTDINYVFSRANTSAWTDTTQSGNFTVVHRLNANLSETGRLAAEHTTLPSGDIDSRTAGLQFGYRRGLPAGGTLTIEVGGSEQLHQNRLNSSEISVTDEAHGAPAPLGAGNGFPLSNPYVAAGSIVVVDTRGGARLPTTVDVDYDILVEGNQTRIVPLLTSAVIQSGDPLLVTYTYHVDPSLKYRTSVGSIGMGLDYGWVSANVAHSESSQKLLEGQNSQFLDEFRTDSATVDLRGTWRSVQGQAGAGFLKYDSVRLVYSQRRLYQFASYRPWRSTNLTLTSNWSVTDYVAPARRSEASSARLALDRFSPGGWTTTATLARRVFNQSEEPTETVNEASLIEKFEYGKFNLMSSITDARQSRGGFQTTNWRFQVSVMRGF